MGLCAAVLYELSQRLLPPPAERTIDYKAYQAWRVQSLSSSWSSFAGTDLRGKDVLDFGCGDGALGLFLATTKGPRSVTGVDLVPTSIASAKAAQSATQIPPGVQVDFMVGSPQGLPVAAESMDVLVAFDCLEHVMSPLAILRDWKRVLRPGGICLLEWFPFKGPWGPHMEALIPVPWAHVIFGQGAMFEAAQRMYDSPRFVPRHWDIDDQGQKKPNKWKNWSSFKEQGYINELDNATFRNLVREAGLEIVSLETRSFGGSAWRRGLGWLLMHIPLIGEYFVSYTVIALRRPFAPT
jgi:SAM-dependent methyltransferase